MNPREVEGLARKGRTDMDEIDSVYAVYGADRYRLGTICARNEEEAKDQARLYYGERYVSVDRLQDVLNENGEIDR